MCYQITPFFSHHNHTHDMKTPPPWICPIRQSEMTSETSLATLAFSLSKYVFIVVHRNTK